MNERVEALATRFATVAELLFTVPVEKLSFDDKAFVSASLAVIEKHTKKRRKGLSALLAHAISEGDVADHEMVPSETGKSMAVLFEDELKLKRTETGGGRTPVLAKVRDLLKKKKIEDSRVIKPTIEKIDEVVVEMLIESHGLDRSSVFKPVGWEVDEAVLRALVAVGHLTEKELDSVYENTKSRVSVSCTFDPHLQKRLLQQLESKGEADGDGDT